MTSSGSPLATTSRSTEELVVVHAGRRAVVRNDRYPKDKLWIFVDGGDREYLGRLAEGMTRGEVKRMARRWFQERVRS